MSRVTIHIQRVIVSSPNFDQSEFAEAVREQVAAMAGSTVREQQVGSLAAARPVSPDAGSAGSAVGKAIARTMR